MDDSKIGWLEATSIGIGGMVGGGIFAVLGLSVQLTHGAAPIAFFLGGIIALFTAYSYAKLSVALASAGGTVYFVDQAYGSNFFTGTTNILLWLSYIIMLSLYAHAFGSYTVSLLPASAQYFDKHVAISSIIIILTILNLLSVKLVGAVEDLVVIIKLVILSLFIIFGIWGIDPQRLSVQEWSSPLNIVIGGMIIFLAYEGFELIANSAKDIRNPSKNLPRAFFTSVILVTVLYILIAFVTAGTLPLNDIIKAKDYALAEAARPSFGYSGFILIAIAAMLSTASAINATLYGAARLSYIIATDGELSSFLEKKIWNKPIIGLLITSILTLIIANVFNLANLALMGSSGFLYIFTTVNIANVLLRKKTNAQAWISLIGAGLCLSALGALIWYTLTTKPIYLLFLIGMISLSALVEATFRLSLYRKIKI